MERAVALARSPNVGLEDLTEKIVSPRATVLASGPRQASDVLTLEEVDRRYIARAIMLVSGNKSRAADLLGLDRRTLYRRLEKYDAAARRTTEAES
jgi:two-component system response regulator HydG